MDLVYRIFDGFVNICYYLIFPIILWSIIQTIMFIYGKIKKQPIDIGWPIALLLPLVLIYKLFDENKRKEIKFIKILLSFMTVIGLL